MKVTLLAMAVVAGCGRIGFPALHDADTRVVDGSVDIPVDALAGPPADACAFGPWTVPADQPFGMVNGPQTDWGVEISRDGLRLVFSSNRPDAAHWYRAGAPFLSWRALLRGCGLPLPEVVVTSDPAEARAFRCRLARDGVSGAVYTPLTAPAGYLLADEASRMPVDQVDMSVHLHKSGYGMGAAADAVRGQAKIADLRQGRHERWGDAVPGRNQHRQHSVIDGQGPHRLAHQMHVVGTDQHVHHGHQPVADQEHV